MKILLFLAVWKRPEITELCFQGIKRLRDYSDRFDIDALAVISEPSMKKLCEKYGIKYIMHENLPLGKKKNAGLNHAFSMEWEYLIEMGSDDIMLNELLDVYEPHMKAGVPYITLSQLAFVNSENGDCMYYKTAGNFGLGRAMSRKMLEPITGRVEVEAKESFFTNGVVVPKGKRDFINPLTAKELQKNGSVDIVGQFTYHLWKDELNRSLDNSSNYLIQSHGINPKVIVHDKPLAIDVKSKENIWPYEASIGVPYSLRTLTENLSEAEKKYFANLKKSKVTA